MPFCAQIDVIAIRAGRHRAARIDDARASTNETGARSGRRRINHPFASIRPGQELAFSTVTARRFCDQHEISLHTATGRSLP